MNELKKTKTKKTMYGGVDPAMYLHRTKGGFYMVRFNKAFLNASGISRQFKLNVYEQEGRIFFQIQKRGRFTAKPTPIKGVFGFHSKDIHKNVERFYEIEITGLAKFDLDKVEVDGLLYWEILNPNKYIER